MSRNLLLFFMHLLTDLSSFLAVEMGKLSSMVALKPPKASGAKKDTAGEKRKEPLSTVHETLPEVETAAVEPTVPKKSRYRKKSDTPKEQGVVFRETPPRNPKLP